MSRLKTVLRRAYYQSGVRRAHIAAYRTALRARSGAIRNSAGLVLHADPDDERAALLAMKRGILDRNAVATWRRLVAEESPTVVIDVGANYGEVSFSTRYTGVRELHLIEPNPVVLHWLRQTVDKAVDPFPRIVLHAGAASAAAGSAWLDAPSDYSGTASLIGDAADGDTHEERDGDINGIQPNDLVEVECFRLDERVDLTNNDSLLFKIDVEGHELPVLKGMTGLFDGRRAVGICEVQHADEEMVDYLCTYFSVSLLRRGAEVPVDGQQLHVTLAQVRASGWGDLSKDVVIRPR